MTQPKALQLANRLETFLEIETNNQAAAELRRLHEENQALRQALAQPEQEPVAWMYTSHYKGNEWFITRYQSELTTYKADKVQPLYTAPPKREWVVLTDEEIRDLWFWSTTKEAEQIANTQQHAFAKAIEAKLKEKNT